MFKTIVATALVAVLASSVPAEAAHVCRNSHGKPFNCHKVVAPRINFHKKHPIKIQRCRGDKGRFNNC